MGYDLPHGYRLTDAHIDHDTIARELSEANRLKESVESFRAACRFTKSSNAYANLGVALMRSDLLGGAHRALSEAIAIDPSSSHAHSNMEVLHSVAKQRGVSKQKLAKWGKDANLKLSTEEAHQHDVLTGRVSGRGSGGNSGTGGSADKAGGSEGEAKGGYHRILTTPGSIAQRGRELIKRGEKRMGRGFLSLALHLNPWLSVELAWLPDAVAGEHMTYWKGNIFVGNDKTELENLASEHFGKVEEPAVYELALYTWRNLEVTMHSCCGIDNVAVFLSRCKKFGHPYLIPFLHLTPDYVGQLKPENQNMYKSFKEWWESTGRRPMPSPPIQYVGNNRWEWSPMKVVMHPSRVPVGWNEFIQAVLLYRLNFYDGARTCLLHALGVNGDLAAVVDELLPGLSTLPVPRPPLPRLAGQKKYIICYNPFVGLGNIAVVMVSAHLLARITGRTMLLDWNVNSISRHAFQLREQPGVQLIGEGAFEAGVVHDDVKILYLFHMMESGALSEMLELLGCANIPAALSDHPVVTVSSNLYFVPLVATNPHVSADTPAHFPKLLSNLLQPSPRAQRRALAYANKTNWGVDVPVIAVHIRAREEGEDNDDWPTRDSPEDRLLQELWKCVEKAVVRELASRPGDWPEYDVFIASTTEKSRTAGAEALKKHASGLRHVLMLPKLERNRRTGLGAIDAMAEALLISRSDVFVRLVVGTSGFSTFAYLSNALRYQTEWASSMAPLRTDKDGYVPNYIVTNDCGPQYCYAGSPKLRMADVSFHGKRATQRSCGDVVERVWKDRDQSAWVDNAFNKCHGLEAVEDGGEDEEL